MKKYLIKALLCAAICGVFSACTNTAELPLADDISAADKIGSTAETAVQTGESDPENGFGYIADADGNIIEYVPAIDIYGDSDQTENNLDLYDTDTIFDSLNAAYPVSTIEAYSEIVSRDNGVEVQIGNGYSKLFVNSESGCNVLAIDSGTVTDQGYRSG